ncbi:MAG TPA: 3-dehydroquinate synthase [Rhizomicrobium sp.]|jgi:3-dehydroquinate synthase|nr:3-dehydroquinate synthase [Rhizomicrobium sp.]
MTQTALVELGPRSYGIHVGPGLLARSGALLKPFVRGRAAIVSDFTVAELYRQPLVDCFERVGVETASVILPPGEGSKNFRTLETLCSALIKAGVDRDGLVIALGGGVIGDLAGFAASILKRGVAVAQLPTTLLAQVDSAIGGKTAIDTAEGKNLVGAFHQPCAVIADTDTLKTLPRRELLGGYAEVVKYAAIGDLSFFEWLEANAAAALSGDGVALARMVARAAGMKARIVSRDERETGERALLNFGHTFGHALEAATGYSGRLSHGEGVAVGMALAFRLSAALGLCAGQESERFVRHLKALGLPTSIAEIEGPRPSPEELIARMAYDKKNRGGRINFILAREIGSAFRSEAVSPEALREVLS